MPSNGAQNDEYPSKTRGEKYYWCCCLRRLAQHVLYECALAFASTTDHWQLNYFVLVFVSVPLIWCAAIRIRLIIITRTHRTHQLSMVWCTRRFIDRILGPERTHRPVSGHTKGEKQIYPNLFIKTDNIICKWFVSPFAAFASPQPSLLRDWALAVRNYALAV